MASEVPTAAGAIPAPARKDPVASIAGQMPYLSTGDSAALRRIYLTERYEADGVVVGLLHRAGVTVPLAPSEFAPWRLLAHVAALLSGTSGAPPHVPDRHVGTALHEAGYSENRLLRLTAARGRVLHEHISRAARMLAQSGKGPVNLWAFLHLAGNDPAKAEEARIRIAQDYYSAAAKA